MATSRLVRVVGFEKKHRCFFCRFNRKLEKTGKNRGKPKNRFIPAEHVIILIDSDRIKTSQAYYIDCTEAVAGLGLVEHAAYYIPGKCLHQPKPGRQQLIQTTYCYTTANTRLLLKYDHYFSLTFRKIYVSGLMIHFLRLRTTI